MGQNSYLYSGTSTLLNIQQQAADTPRILEKARIDLKLGLCLTVECVRPDCQPCSEYNSRSACTANALQILTGKMGCWMAACVHMPEARIHGWTAMDIETKGGFRKTKSSGGQGTWESLAERVAFEKHLDFGRGIENMAYSNGLLFISDSVCLPSLLPSLLFN